jgi:hypothetical protein
MRARCARRPSCRALQLALPRAAFVYLRQALFGKGRDEKLGDRCPTRPCQDCPPPRGTFSSRALARQCSNCRSRAGSSSNLGAASRVPSRVLRMRLRLLGLVLSWVRPLLFGAGWMECFCGVQLFRLLWSGSSLGQVPRGGEALRTLRSDDALSRKLSSLGRRGNRRASVVDRCK